MTHTTPHGSTSQRWQLFIAAAVCLGIVVVLAVVVQIRWDALYDVDNDLGTPAQAWSIRTAGAGEVLLVIEAMFGTVGTVAYVLVLVTSLWCRGHRVAAGWTVVVMVGTSVTTTVMKLSLQRDRPQWADPVHTLESFSFPSGHASGIASGMGVVVVLTMLYVGRKAARLAVFVVAASLVVVVGADRILLGVHNLSDVLAGYALGAFWVLAMLALCPPVGSVNRTGAVEGS